MRVNVFVNGYGAPEDPLEDGDMTRYLGAVMKYIKSRPDCEFTLFFAGGCTNNPIDSEARAMWKWIIGNNQTPRNVDNIVCIEDTTTGRDNLRRYAGMVAPNTPSIFFCEYSRRPHVVFFVKKFLPDRKYWEKYEVIGVPFDAKSMKLANRVKEYLFKYPLLVLSWYCPFINKYVVQPLRRRHVAMCRREKR